MKKENSDTNNNIVVGGRDEFEEDEGIVVGSLKPVTTNILVHYGPCLMGIIVKYHDSCSSSRGNSIGGSCNRPLI